MRMKEIHGKIVIHCVGVKSPYTRAHTPTLLTIRPGVEWEKHFYEERIKTTACNRNVITGMRDCVYKRVSLAVLVR